MWYSSDWESKKFSLPLLYIVDRNSWIGEKFPRCVFLWDRCTVPQSFRVQGLWYAQSVILESFTKEIRPLWILPKDLLPINAVRNCTQSLSTSRRSGAPSLLSCGARPRVGRPASAGAGRASPASVRAVGGQGLGAATSTRAPREGSRVEPGVWSSSFDPRRGRGGRGRPAARGRARVLPVQGPLPAG